jgi:hypothetical protein
MDLKVLKFWTLYEMRPININKIFFFKKENLVLVPPGYTIIVIFFLDLVPSWTNLFYCNFNNLLAKHLRPGANIGSMAAYSPQTFYGKVNNQM